MRFEGFLCQQVPVPAFSSFIDNIKLMTSQGSVGRLMAEGIIAGTHG